MMEVEIVKVKRVEKPTYTPKTYADFTPAEIRRQIIWLLEQIDDMEALKKIDGLVNRLHWEA